MHGERDGRGSRRTLRSLVTTGSIVLTALALFACATLVVVATLQRHTSRNVADATAIIRSADGVRVSLLAYARESDLAYLAHEPAYESTRQRTAADLLARIDDAKAKAGSPQQRQLLDRADQKIRRYLEVRREAEVRNDSLQQILGTATAPLQDALSTLRQLVAIDDRAVSEARHTAQRRADLGRLAGSIVALLIVIGFAVVLVLLQRLVVAPLLSLSDCIRRLAGGDLQARITLRGPAELERTAAAFNEMAERLARHEEERRIFLAGVAHDLRNPLSVLRMRVQMIQRGSELPAEPKLRDTIAVIGQQVARLDRMTGDLVDANQIASGHLELQLTSVDLRDAARETIALYGDAATSHSLSLSLPDEPVVVRCDPMRIAQVLNNLISNAIKYSPRGGEVSLRLRTDGADAVVEVTDHGIGIPPQELGRVFEPFHRGAASRETVPGVGLGLSVARQLVEAHAGHLDVESAVGVGSTFRLRLPLASRPPALNEPPRPQV